ncbi:MAG: hybrid sensor histidine kinase/response regulator [Planctomycetaceae bacterium]|nr:hybrid sensor histidine kinase/response regulator [Planctomycetaceae bacterium]
MTNPLLHILIVEGHPADADVLIQVLCQAGYELDTVRVRTEVEYLAHLDPAPDVILCDNNSPSLDAMQALYLLQERRPGLPFLIVSDSIGEWSVVEAIKWGATDYLHRDRLERLCSSVEHAVHERRLREAERNARVALRMSEERYQALAEGIPHIVWTARPNGEIDYVNQQTVEYTGRAAADLVGSGWESSIHPDDLARTLQLWAEAVQSGNPRENEFRLRRADGEYRWHLTRQFVTRDELGEVARWVGTCTDIDDRRCAERELRDSEAFVRAVLDSIDSHIAVLDVNGTIRATNAAWQTFETESCGVNSLGRSVGANYLTACDNSALAGCGDAEAAARGIRTIIAGESPRFTLEYPCHSPRQRRWFMLSVTPLRGAGCVVSHIDITERKEAEEAFQRAQERLQHVITSSPSVLFKLAVDADHIGGLNWVSENVEAVLGYPLGTALSQDWWETNVHPEDRDRVVAERDQGLIGTGRVSTEYRFRHRSGQFRWIRSEVRLVLDATGESIEAIGSWTDVTERRQIEDQYRQAQKMEAFGQLAAGVAHDFNNLLTIINGYSDMLSEELLQTDSHRVMSVEIREAGGRAAALTAQLLAFSRKTIIEPKILNLNELVEQTGKLLNRLIGEDIKLTLKIAPTLHRVRADQSQIEQVIMNLALNARDAMPKGGHLTIETKNIESVVTASLLAPTAQSEQFVQVSVSDTGTGMTDEVKAKIFEPFFTTKGVGKGTGLGLATVYGIVKQAGGQIEVNSTLGTGTTFTVQLPAVSILSSEPRPSGLVSPARGTETILLVEDEQAVRKYTRQALEKQGYKVLEAASGVEAIHVAEKHTGPIHLLVTDVVMPGMGGRDLSEAIRARLPEVRVLFMSGYTDDAVVRHGVVDATDAFLQKPFAPLALARKVRAILDTNV